MFNLLCRLCAPILLSIITVLTAGNPAMAQEDLGEAVTEQVSEPEEAEAFHARKPLQKEWPHKSIFGQYDRAAAQRGLKVYTQVCAVCHGMEHVAFRDLADLGYSEAQVQKIAEEWPVQAPQGVNASWEMALAAPEANDPIPSPYPNDEAAAEVNNGAPPPDLSVIVKARPGGENYIYSLLVGYEEEAPADFDLLAGTHYNPYFASGQLSMPRPLWGDDVVYDDGTEATLAQEAYDVTTFLAWAAEPKLEARKSMGLKVMIYLALLAVLLFFVNRRVWSDVKKK